MFISVKTLEVLGKKSSSAGRIWVIADTMLADGNGIAICCKIKRDDRIGHLPVMMMSAHAILRDVRKKCQADAYFSQPFDIDNFKGKVSYLDA